MSNLQLFESTFGIHLRNSSRWSAFRFLAETLFSLDRPIHIGETGCLRLRDNWAGDGQSTRLWDFIAGATKGSSFSVDINPNNCSVAQSLCPNTEVICGDSLRVLGSLEKERLSRLDLLFLDSYDFASPHGLSMLHHMGELAIVWSQLKSGCLIAIDDCLREDLGKHGYVQKFMSDMNIEPVHRSYITIWRKR